MNFYNDIDWKACAWTQGLIDEGLIPPGHVACKSITDITPEELNGHTQCHFFNGVSGWAEALHLAGFPTTRTVWCASLPCQPFSAAGLQRGLADERHLWPVFFRLVQSCRPELIIGEQVERAIGLGWLDGVRTDLEAEGYAFGFIVLGAHSAGSPHIRQRLYWMAHPIIGRWPGRDERGLGTDRQQVGQPQNGTDSPDEPRHGCDQVGGVVHPELRRPEQRDAGIGDVQEPDAGRTDGGMAHPTERGLRADRSAPGSTGHAQQREQDGVAGCQFCGYEFDHGVLGKYGCPNCEGVGLADMQREGLEGHPRHGGDGHEPGRLDQDTARPAPQSGESFWSNSIWHPGRDGKARRIPSPQPVFQRMAHGLTDGMDLGGAEGAFPLAPPIPHRAALLKGYGNAIVPPLAAEFIKTVMEIVP